MLTEDREKLEKIRQRLRIDGLLGDVHYGLAGEEVAYLVDLAERLEQVSQQLTDNLQLWMDEANRLKSELEKCQGVTDERPTTRTDP
jgi:hypothetical protein